MSAGARHPTSRSWRIRLPAGVRTPFDVYINGVRQELGVDYRLEGGELIFGRELIKQKLSLWAWFLGAWGIGTYKRNDEIDIRYQLGERTVVAHVSEVIPPSGPPPA